MAPALLTAFSTSSSAATLPLTMECVEKNAGVSNRTSSFVLPLGATVNMDGTALYECVAAMFIAQAYGIELGLVQQFTIVLMALVTSIGVAAIPSASLVAIAIILAAVGLPVEAIGMILAVDQRAGHVSHVGKCVQRFLRCSNHCALCRGGKCTRRASAGAIRIAANAPVPG